MSHVLLLVAAGVPNVQPDYNNPATPFFTKLVELVLFALAMLAVVVFFGGGAKVVTSLGSTRDGGARSGVFMMIGAAIFLAFVSTGTSLLNTWAGWFGG